MKNFRIATLLFFALFVSLFAGCKQAGPGNDQLSKRTQDLESKVTRLQERSDDQALKSRIVGSLLSRSPLEDFFASPEFWENTYDSGQADCAKRCISNLTAEKAACLRKPTDAEKQTCNQEAVARASTCQTRCSQSFPPT
jgi:outer membrane murein-binding lipoprotein Lpp